MRDVPGLPSGSILGYCTNVHAGATLEQTKKNLEQYALAIKARVSPNEPMGIGLWFSHSSAVELNSEIETGRLQQFIEKQALDVFTLNGFPYGDFHVQYVKHSVYSPDWDSPSRATYTLSLARILRNLPGNAERSISTLPIAWPSSKTPADLSVAIKHLLMCVCMLHWMHEQFGILIHIDLEPEPGCVLQRSNDVVDLFQNHLLPNVGDFDTTEELVFRHLRVCHDICHAAVMFEDQAEMIARYRAAGIQIGKVQISNAIRADLRNLSARERVEALAQLCQFSEDRYLHQTMIRDGDQIRFFDDLPKALADFGSTDRAGDEWRVHFHVPVYLESFGHLQTTRDYILECMRLLKDSEVKHWEVETYAWNVLPKELQVPDLAAGIAKELLWVKEQAATIA